MATILSVPVRNHFFLMLLQASERLLQLSNQLQVPYIKMRSIYEIREQPSRMYAWSALVTSQLMVEIPLNIINSSIFFLCWYWTVGFDSNRGAYTYLFLSFLMPLVRPSSFLTFHSRLIVSCPSTVLYVLLFPLTSSNIHVN
jgi:ATP-binding cassette subfamily G (WHITE) protein 2 (SNQ2)